MSRQRIEERLPRLLREAHVPDAEAAEARGLRLAAAAFAERAESAKPDDARPRASLPRLALALAIAALLAALLLTPAGASVRHWVGDVFSADVPRAQPGLGRTPGGGRLLVVSKAGPWVLHRDGSRRLLGDYDEAAWSPHGLFVAAAEGRTLSAVEPDGTPHWSLTAAGRVSDVSWSPSGYRIAYRSGRQLRVAYADDSKDFEVAAASAPVAPVWMPLGLYDVAYVDGSGRVRIAEAEGGRQIAAAPALPGVRSLEWGGRGRFLLEASASAVRLRPLRIEKLALGMEIEPGHRLPLPARAVVRDAALAPGGGTVAVLLSTPLAAASGGQGTRSTVLLFGPTGPPRRLLTVPGRLAQIAFSPNGKRLLVTWPEADEWLYLPLGHGRPSAVGDVSAAFAPGERAAPFPRIAGWCCSR
jgi:hypothetical protein